MDLRLVIGLGNPGEKYVSTRHNVGFMVLDALAREQGYVWREQKKFFGEITQGEGMYDGITFLKPQTFMNSSGKSVATLCNYFGIEPNECCVIYDDIALPFSTIRIREQGSAGGHNGMKDIIASFGTEAIARIRIGIRGEHADSYALEEYVLQSFSTHELREFAPVITRAVNLTKTACQLGIATAIRAQSTS